MAGTTRTQPASGDALAPPSGPKTVIVASCEKIDRMAERRRLYDAGLGDRDIARKQGVDRTAIKDWRKRQRLPSNVQTSVTKNPSHLTASDPTTVDLMAERRKLYDAGHDDRAIARQQGVNRTSIKDWRKRRGLPSNVQARAAGQPTPEAAASTEVARIELHAQGLTDTEIASRQNVLKASICQWRMRRGLPANLGSGPGYRSDATIAMTAEMRDLCTKLLRKNIGASTIARELHFARSTVDLLRTRMLATDPHLRRSKSVPRVRVRYPSGRAYSRLLPERRLQAFTLYADGLSDPEIAEQMGLNRQQIGEWRRSFWLQANVGMPKKARRPKSLVLAPAITARSNPIYAAMADAVGNWVLSDLSDDAISEMWLALEEGRLAIADIAAKASHFRSNVIREYANKFGARSIDEVISGTDDLRLIDTLRDDRMSSWLEDMGATIW